MPPGGWTLGRRPALDGLRGLAVLLVVASHVELLPLAGGMFGVTVFFVLSGFLITTLLCEELERSGGRLNLRRFYERRALRLLPALIAVVLVTVALSALLGVRFASWIEVLGALFYCSNLLALVVPAEGGGMLHHTWSLVIEEQFYLLWPAVLLPLWRRRGLLLGLLAAGAVLSMLQRVRLWDQLPTDFERVMYGTDTRVDGILIGCAVAVAVRERVPRLSPTAVSLSLLTLLALTLLWPAGPAFVLGLSLAALITAAAVLGVIGDRAPRWLELRWLTAIGQRSYGLYLWHHVVLILVIRTFPVEGNWVALTLLVVPASALLTVLSWRFIETPFLRLKDRPSRAARPRTSRSGVSTRSD